MLYPGQFSELPSPFPTCRDQSYSGTEPGIQSSKFYPIALDDYAWKVRWLPRQEALSPFFHANWRTRLMMYFIALHPSYSSCFWDRGRMNKTCEWLNESDRGERVQKRLFHWASCSLPVLSSFSTTELPHFTIPKACVPFDPQSLEMPFIVWQFHLSAGAACPHHWPGSKEAWARVHSHIF